MKPDFKKLDETMKAKNKKAYKKVMVALKYSTIHEMLYDLHMNKDMNSRSIAELFTYHSGKIITYNAVRGILVNRGWVNRKSYYQEQPKNPNLKICSCCLRNPVKEGNAMLCRYCEKTSDFNRYNSHNPYDCPIGEHSVNYV